MLTIPRWLWRGNWNPEQVSGAVLVVQLGALAGCLIRGLDYMRQNRDTTYVLSRVQDSAPLPVWGGVFIFAAALVIVGMAGHWGNLVGIGHLLAGAVYGGVSYGLFLETHFGPGVRTPFGLLVASVIHFAFGIGTFAALRQTEESIHPSCPT
jgi:hypothetical protein